MKTAPRGHYRTIVENSYVQDYEYKSGELYFKS